VLHVGIDEAGYGPLLGPLVIGLSAWRVQGATQDEDPGGVLAQRLGALVVPARGRRPREALPVPVDDSKRLHGRDGVTGLARAVGAFAAALDQAPPADLEDLLRRYGEVPPSAFRALPWFATLADEAVPRYPWTGPLHEAFDACGVAALDLRAWAVDVPAFNDALADGSKADVLARFGGCLLTRFLDRFPGEDAHIVFDRHGSRRDYRAWLGALFPFAPLAEVVRAPHESRYRIDLPDRRLHLAFRTRADGNDLAVAWASVLAKLTRELFMGRLNAWFGERVPGLRPTAGYVTDGRRFLADVAPVLERERIPGDWLVRAR
jgi:hypothetical protein